MLPQPLQARPGPIPDLRGAPGRPGAPGPRASSADSHRRPSPSGSRAGGGAEGLGRSLVLLLPQWPWPCLGLDPGSEDEGQQPPGTRKVAPGPPGTGAGEEWEAGAGARRQEAGGGRREAGAPPRDNAPAPDWPGARRWEPMQVRAGGAEPRPGSGAAPAVLAAEGSRERRARLHPVSGTKVPPYILQTPARSVHPPPFCWKLPNTTPQTRDRVSCRREKPATGCKESGGTEIKGHKKERPSEGARKSISHLLFVP